MKLTELPPELLIHILSFVPQRDIFLYVNRSSKYVNEICSSPAIWTTIRYSNTYSQISEPLAHFYQIQHYIKILVIKADDLAEVFQCHIQIRLPNVKRLTILENVTNDAWKYFISGEFVELFPGLEKLTFSLSSHLSMIVCLHVLTEFSLNALSIGHNAFTSVDDALISFISTQSKLQQLNLYGVIQVSDETIATILNEFPNITMIGLSRQKISSKVFTSSNKPLPLSRFKVHSDKLEDGGFESLMQRSSRLTSLNIEHCNKITNRGLQNFITCGAYLQELSIGYYDDVHKSHLSNQTLQIIGFGCHRLQHFSALGCSSIDCTGVSALVKSCQHLKTLVLKNCRNITDEMLLWIAKSESLERLSLYGKVNISLNSVISVLQSCKQMDEFLLNGIYNYPTNFKHISEKMEPSDFADMRTEDVDSKIFHSHVKLLNITCNRDVSKENILRLTKLCTDLRTLVVDYNFLIGIDGTFMYELFLNCLFLARVSLHGKTFNRLKFIQPNK